MSDQTGIEWSDATWNCVVGCTPVSPGCLNCYAARMARRLEAMGQKDYAPREIEREPVSPRSKGERLEGVWCKCGGEIWFEKVKASPGWTWEAFCRECKACDANGYASRGALIKESPLHWGDHRIRIAEVRGGRAVFNGVVRCLPDRLSVPLKWKTPRRVFVNSMSDLFHAAVPFEFIDKVFAVMALSPRHTFQILTKRPERMAEYLGERTGCHIADVVEAMERAHGVKGEPFFWPLRNVWLGTSCEDQAAADERIPHLLRCPAVVRFISAEPLLGAVDLTRIDFGVPGVQNVLDCRVSEIAKRAGIDKLNGIDWVIVGGESGPGARPCPTVWRRSIIEQCRAAGVPVFHKQSGAWVDAGHFTSFTQWVNKAQSWLRPFKRGTVECFDALGRHCPTGAQFMRARDESAFPVTYMVKTSGKGGELSEWLEDLRVREMPGGAGA